MDDNKSTLAKLETDFNRFRDALRETSADLLREGYTDFPIFIATDTDVDLGEMLLDKAEYASSFSFMVSTVEEFGEKGIIPDDRQEEFRKAYKDPKTHCCVFLLTPAVQNIIFVPWKKTGKEEPGAAGNHE